MFDIKSSCRIAITLILAFAFLCIVPGARAQSAGSVEGTVLDPDGKVVVGASVELHNVVSQYDEKTKTDDQGHFRFTNIPFNPYHLSVGFKNLQGFSQDVDVRSGVPVTLKINMKLATAAVSTVVEAIGGDLLENDPVPHTDVDRNLFAKLPLESASSSLSSLVTLASPGIAADSNGLFHAMGDHADNQFSVDGQPITDQQSKVFSNQIPMDSIQSIEVIQGAPPAEYGGKTSLIINVTTRSGLGQHAPTGDVTGGYGSFGTSTGGFNLALGTDRIGNYFSASGVNTGRFLDPPEFQVFHSKGNGENLFDRLDFRIGANDILHLNMSYLRSWYQEPNSFDSAAIGQDQRAQILTYNIAPSYSHTFGATSTLNVTAFLRRDDFNYYPSGNPFSDLSETVRQTRFLTNAGARADFNYVKGIHNIKIGAQLSHTFLVENFHLGLTDPTLNSPCLDMNNNPVGDTTLTDPTQCAGAGFQPNIAANPNASAPFVPLLGCVDLTRTTPSINDSCSGVHSTLFGFHGYTDIKEISFYAQDSITKGNWNISLGIRGELYRGLSRSSQPEPRAGIAYNIKKTGTVLRISYARIMESPFNENLIMASSTNNPFLAAIFGQTAASPIPPGLRNDFHAGFEQSFGKYLVVSADYVWKYTHNAYDFSDLLNTPIFFPIAWHNSKITGPTGRISMPDFHGFSAFAVFGSVSARFFDPQLAGLGSSPASGVFRIDHDQVFQQTTHVQYQWKRTGPWIGFNWRYDSGLVAGAVPFATDTITPVDLTGLTADQQLQAGLFCGSQHPTLVAPLTTCAPSLYGSTRIIIPAPGTQDDDHNPARIAPRHLFDVAAGMDNVFHGDRYKWSVRFTVINLTNKVALYNFLSTFSGTHFVTPRTYLGELGFHF
jgi:hypothetical protein